MKKHAVAAVATVMLGVGGCATAASAEGVAPGSSAEVDTEYLEHVRDVDPTFPGSAVANMSSQALLSAASESCRQMQYTDGDFAAVRVIPGEQAGPNGGYWTSATIAAHASLYYCTQWAPEHMRD